MHRATITVNSVPTEVITYNRWVEESSDGKNDVIIFITGHLGVPAFYEEFGRQLQLTLPSEVPIWIIGHTGHTKPPDNVPDFYPDFKTFRHLYDLKGNLEHKAEFIKKYVPPNARIHLVAHSIGCWFALNLLRDSVIADKVLKCYLLFPTIERMAESPYGQLIKNIVLRIAAFLIFMAWIFTLFPSIIQVLLIRTFGIFYGIPASLTNAAIQIIHPIPFERICMMSEDEMITVKDLDDDLISQHKKKLYLYYGSDDGWTPIHYYEDLKSKFPDLDVHLDKRGFHHDSLVLRNSVEVGKMIGDLICESMSSKST